MGDPNLSATQITDFRLCKRRWGWPKLDGIKGPPNRFAEKGLKVHDILERWLRDGVGIDIGTEEGEIAASGIQHLPPPGPDLVVEEWITLHSEVATYVGKVDLAYINPKSGRWVVHDHKTTSGFGWAKTKEELKHDPQGVLYAAERMARNAVNEVELSWLYMVTKGKKKSKRVHLVMTRTDVEIGLEEIDKTAVEMIAAHRAGKKALDLTFNPGACMTYGGCPYIDNCNLSTMDIMKAARNHMAEGESVVEKMKRERAERAAAAAGANGTPAPVTPPVTPAAAPVSPPAAAGPKVNPPEKPAGAPKPSAGPATAPLALDLSPLVNALKEYAAKHAPIELRDQLALAICSSGDPTAIENAYELADIALKGRGGKAK